MNPEEARREARRILREARFRRRTPPRPLHGVLRWIGDRLEPITNVGRHVGHSPVLATALAVGVLLAAGALATIVVHRRSVAVAGGDASGRRGGRAEDPSDLERRAEHADRDGDFELALRLRFRAGLLRLDAAGALEYRSSLTTGAVVRAVTSPALAGLAHTLEEVVYGGRAALAEDVVESRTGWPVVLAEQRRA